MEPVVVVVEFQMKELQRICPALMDTNIRKCIGLDTLKDSDVSLSQVGRVHPDVDESINLLSASEIRKAHQEVKSMNDTIHGVPHSVPFIESKVLPANQLMRKIKTGLISGIEEALEELFNTLW